MTDLMQVFQDRVAEDRHKKDALAHEELESRTHAILGDVAELQKRRAALPAGSPDIAAIDKSLQEHQQAFTDLYHPTKNPNAFQKLGGFLKQHITGKAPAPAPPSNAVTPGRMASLSASAAGTATPDPYLTPDDLKKKARIAAGLDPAAVAPRPDAENWKWDTVTLADGRQLTIQHNLKDGTTLDLNGKPVPPELLSSATLSPKPTAQKDVRAWKKGKDGKIISVLIDPKTNKPIPGTENGDILPPPGMTGRISTGYYHYVDDKGDVHAIEETRTSGPMPGGGAPPIKTPGDAKARAASVAPKGDKVYGHKDTPVQAKARKDVTDATKLDSIAKQVEQNPNDAVNQKRLAVALERQAAGRFTTQALDYIIKAGWGNTIEQWMNNPSTGALPKEVMRQLIDGAHQNLKGAQDALDSTLKGSQSTPSSDSDIDDIVKALGKK